MFLFGFGSGRRGRIYIAARLALLVAFLIAVFVFHAHGTTRDVLQVIRVALLVALLASGLIARRRTRGSGQSGSTP